MRKLRLAAALVSSFLVLIGVAAAAVAPSGPATSTGTGGAAASVETLATQAAIDALKRGGNAVDAAVTAAGVLGVAEPFSCGIGGGGFMVIRRASDGKVTTIDGRETAPVAMTPTSFMWAGGKAPDFTTARYSGMSVGVPGTPATWGEALEKYGTFSLAQALAPGIALGRNGFVVDQVFHDQIAGNQQAFRDVPSSAALYLKPDGTALDVGTVFRNPDLASTYERIAHLGLKGFYRGAVAAAIVNMVQAPPVTTTATPGLWHPGVMTMRDLHDYVAPERAPTHVTYHGADVYGMGPPSSGGSTVGEALNILEPYNLGTLPRDQALHYYLEASRYAYADRNQYLADPDYVNVPLKGLLSKDYAATRRALIKETAATSPVGWGDPWPYNGGGGQGLDLGGRARTDDPPVGRRPQRQRRVVHVHDRADRRRRDGRARLRVPRQQRADGLQLRLDRHGEPGRGRETAAQLDEPDDRPQGRQAVPRAWLTRRRDDHHDRSANARQPTRLRDDVARRARGAAREPAELELDASGAGVHRHLGQRSQRAWAHLQLDVGDRRSDRDRVPRRRPRDSRSGARPAGRRQR